MQIIKDGGYATSLTYVEKLCSIIERWNLTQYDSSEAPAPAEVKWYRVRKSWSDAASQKGAFKILDNAKVCAACLPGCVWNATPRSLSPLERNIDFWTQA